MFRCTNILINCKTKISFLKATEDYKELTIQIWKNNSQFLNKMWDFYLLYTKGASAIQMHFGKKDKICVTCSTYGP